MNQETVAAELLRPGDTLLHFSPARGDVKAEVVRVHVRSVELRDASTLWINGVPFNTARHPKEGVCRLVRHNDE